MRQAATTVNRIDVYICPSSRTLNAFKFAKGILVNENLYEDVGDKVMIWCFQYLPLTSCHPFVPDKSIFSHNFMSCSILFIRKK